MTVTVVTPTKGRPDLLERALRSVAAQEGVSAVHVVVGDDCPHLGDEDRRRALEAEFPHARFVNVRPGDHPGMPQDYLPARLAHLRNFGISLADTPYVAHLDDDNAYAPDHLRSLVDLLERTPGAEVAHSWRRLLTHDGADYVPDGEDPWHPIPRQRAASYRSLAEQGVFVPGSSVVRDAMRVIDGKLLSRVDTNELLIRRETHARIPFPTTYTVWQRILETTEDMALCQELLRHGVSTACSERPTVDYYMGGFSNAAALV
ncbi:glycosyltransferase family A protein [Streptomyces sp. NPDC005828]|uniref:glycosyltransferase family A protein n=1 Tax=Streptomyces sp. NPDC005828 TaxID=3157071 RepID=UPI0033DB4AC7